MRERTVSSRARSLAADQKDNGLAGRLFERFQQSVLCRQVQSFGVVDNRDATRAARRSRSQAIESRRGLVQSGLRQRFGCASDVSEIRMYAGRELHASGAAFASWGSGAGLRPVRAAREEPCAPGNAATVQQKSAPGDRSHRIAWATPLATSRLANPARTGQQIGMRRPPLRAPARANRLDRDFRLLPLAAS